jgi:hypothetical protein
VKVPESLSASDSTKSLSVDEIETAFESSNPWLKPEMIAVSCRGENLLDVRICFGRDLFPRACGANEDEPRLCRINKIAVPPDRRGAFPPAVIEIWCCRPLAPRVINGPEPNRVVAPLNLRAACGS